MQILQSLDFYLKKSLLWKISNSASTIENLEKLYHKFHLLLDYVSINRLFIYLFIHRAWEFKHMDLSWDFRKDLGAKVRGLLTILEHPINMAHLSKLFTAQLIISCNFDVNCQFFF